MPARTRDPTRMSHFGFVLFLTIIPSASIFWEGHTDINLSEAPTSLASATAPKAWTLPSAMQTEAHIKGPSGGLPS